MSLYEKQARYRRPHGEQASWRLLRADSAPIILAFPDDLFSNLASSDPMLAK